MRTTRWHRHCRRHLLAEPELSIALRVTECLNRLFEVVDADLWVCVQLSPIRAGTCAGSFICAISCTSADGTRWRVLTGRGWSCGGDGGA